MKLRELDVKSLIEMIENPANQDTPDQLLARTELKGRNVSDENIKVLAIEVNEAIAYELLMSDDITKEEVSMHESTFLTQEEVQKIYKEQLEKYMKYKDQFRFDVWSYAVGGI